MVDKDVQISSKDYYKDLQGLKQTEQDRIAILLCIRERQPICDRELEELLDRPINVITGRRYELVRKFGLVKEGVVKPYDKPKGVIHWVDAINPRYGEEIIGVDEL